jgi:hypothetical protein
MVAGETRFRGHDEIVGFHDPLFKTHLKGTRLVGDLTDVRSSARMSPWFMRMEGACLVESHAGLELTRNQGS